MYNKYINNNNKEMRKDMKKSESSFVKENEPVMILSISQVVQVYGEKFLQRSQN